ncbi:MAG: SDR family NAD(P)-dependent oxidoreductase [Parachlamydia sp.]|nr:SDR family NAD(P)-dependent oxidoreductase [Parachlamydia sp.]
MTYELALVTGATSGIGYALCRLLARQGISLLVTGRNAAQLGALQKEFPDLVHKAFTADLSTSEGVAQIIEIIQEYSPDLVINNAGFGLYGDVLSYSMEESEKMIAVNIEAVMKLSIEAARALVSNQQKGTILNVASAAAFLTAPILAVYAASKAFVVSFSSSFDQEVKSHGVRVLAACPGMVETAFSERAGANKRHEKQGVMSVDYAAEAIWKQILRLKPVEIIDWKVRLLICLSRCLPRKWSAALFKNIMLERIAPRPLILRPPCKKKKNS